MAVGRALGRWRRRWVMLGQDAYIESWKEAWTDGCYSGWHGEPLNSVPYRRGYRRHAWMAGWNWATQPERREETRERVGVATERPPARHPRLVRAAKGGALGLLLLITARWLIPSKSRSAGGSG
jgi:hypothetical protein